MTEPLDLDAIERGDVSVCTCYPSCCEDNLALIAEVKRLRAERDKLRGWVSKSRAALPDFEKGEAQ